MKPALHSFRGARMIGLVATMLSWFPASLPAQDADPVPVIEFTPGLPGTQARITWVAEPGARYAVEKSPDLSPGSWKRLALVEPTQADAVWLDPEMVTERCFYRVTKPRAEVFSIEPAVLTASGGLLVIRGQALPPGSSLMLETEGGGTQFFALIPQGDGTWHADVTGTFAPGAALTARVRAGGQILPVAVHPVVTIDGLTPDGLASLPPAAPVPGVHASNPIPGVGIVVKRNPPYTKPHQRSAGPGENPLYENESMGGENPLYEGRGAHNNPAFQENSNSGEMPTPHAPLFSGRPGEVGFHACDFALHTPAGPALSWVRTYRSKGGTAPDGTTFSYDIRIEPDPTGLGAAAPRVRVFDGTGRCDTFHRQDDGTFTCDGLFREGRFVGEVFTLRFFDKGRWVFHGLNGSPTAGKISSIIDVHGNALTCDYDASGQLASVSNAFGQSLTVARDTQGRVATVTDHTGRFIAYSYFEQGETDGPPGFVKSVSCPITPGLPPVCGPVSYTYTTDQPHSSLDGNLLSIHDGAGRLLEAFTYSTQTDPAAIDFDTLATHDAHRTDPVSDAVCVLKLVRLPAGVAPFGGYTVFHNDEAGRLIEIVCDTMHRPVSVRQFTGFTTPGQACDATTNRPTNKLRAADPDFYQTTASYNADGMPRRCTLPDGTQLVAVFERDLNPACAARERGNARTLTIRSSSGEERTVSCDYLTGFGTPESARPGNPIGGLTIKAGRNPGGLGAQATRRRVEVLKSNFQDASAARGNPIKGMVIRTGPRNGSGATANNAALLLRGVDKKDIRRGMVIVKPGTARLKKEEGGRHTPFHNRISGDDIDNDCDGVDDDCDGIGMTAMFRKILDRGEAGDNVGPLASTTGKGNGRRDSDTWQAGPIFILAPQITRLTSGHGQVFTWTYDAHGRCVAHATPIPGHGFTASYDALGRCVSTTLLDGAGPGFRTDIGYDPATGFLRSVTVDPTGLALTETQDCDDLGRPIRYTDPRGHQWLVEYNAADLPTRIDSPPGQGGNPIISRFHYDGGGSFWCGTTEHLRSDGSPVQDNLEYSTIVVRDARCRVVRVAEEIFPVAFDPSSVVDPASLGLENFAVLDITYGPDGRCARLSVPAASRQATEDEVCDFTYDERGMLHRVMRGGPAGVTHEYHRTAAGQVSRRAIVAPGLPSSEVHFEYDGFHRVSSVTDPMGNETTYGYSRTGHVSVSWFGEVEDVPGDAGNVLLGRIRVRYADGVSLPAPAAREPTAVMAMACTAGARRGRDTGDCDDANPFFDALTLPNVGEVCYEIKTRTETSTTRSASAPGPDRDCDDDDDDGDALTLGGADDVCYPLEVEANIASSVSSFFHGVAVRDDTVEAERFAPGQPGPHPVELTTVTRSPAGLPLHISLNGDTLASLAYDTAGRLVRCEDGACRVEVVRDASGNITSSTRTDFFTEAGIPPKTFTMGCVIDSLGRVSTLSDSAGNHIAFACDSLHRVTSFADPAGVALTAEYDVSSAVGRFNIRYAKDLDGDGSPEILGTVTQPAVNQRTCTCPLGYFARSSADPLGRLARCDYPDGTFETFSYDARGFPSQIRRRDGSILSLACDLNGRVVSESIAGGADREFTYDGRSRCVRVEEDSSVCAWSHDSLGNVLSETASGETITHTYDHRGRTSYATSVQGPYQLRVAETRDAQGRLRVVSDLDATGQPVSPPVATMEYLGRRVCTCHSGNRVSTVHTFRGDGDPALPDTTNFGFDLCVQTESSHLGIVFFLSKKGYDYYQAQSSMRIIHRDLAARNILLDKDPLGRVRTGQIVFDAGDGILKTEHEVAYTLNARGDRLSATGGDNPGSYTQSDTLPPGDAQRGCYTSWPRGLAEWNALGNLTSLPTAQGPREYQYDSRARLVAVIDGATGSLVVEFSYDGCDRLVERNIHAGAGLPSVTTRFLYDGRVCVHEIDVATGTPERSHVVCGTTSHFRTTTSGGAVYYGNGGGGDIAYVGPCDASSTTDATGAVVEVVASDESGKPLFFDGDGLPSSTGQSLTGRSWLRPGALWVPAADLHLHGGSSSMPALGIQVSQGKTHTKTGHVTLMK